MSTATKPSEEHILKAREFIRATGSKVRPGGKMTINTETFEVKNWATIEIWDKKKRRYFPVQIGGIWRYETEVERDEVMALLTTKGRP